MESRYRAYRERLERFHERLASEVRGEAPDLHARLSAAAAGALQHGYQVVPKIVPGPPPGTPPPKVASGSYSWRLTQEVIDADLGRLERLEAGASASAGMPLDERRKAREQQVTECLRLVASQKRLDSLVQYNRLWQHEIHHHRAAYDRATVLHDAVVERQAILDQARQGRASVDTALPQREIALTRQIRQATERLVRPDFIRLERPAPHTWVIRIPFSTDIDSPSFVDAFRAAVEQTWRVVDGDDDFRVVLDMQPIAPQRLYAGQSPPAAGEKIDLAKHLSRFPDGRAILTTGATLTHVSTRWSIVLGPHDISARVLSHELGHILGFPDGYFRGYRDRGPDGYEVLEVITDPEDIMSAPGFGRAQRNHFAALLRSVGAPLPERSGAAWPGPTAPIPTAAGRASY